MSAAYPTLPAAVARPRVRPPSGGTAETLVLVGLVLQVIGAAAMALAFGWLIGLSVVSPYPWAWLVVTVVVAVASLTIVFLYLAYTLSYQRIRRGEYEAAQAPTLVMGILSLFFGVVPGILYIVAYLKLGDALREQFGALGPYAYGAAAPAAPGPVPVQVACRGCGRVYPIGTFGFCPSCGQKLGA